MKHHQVKDVAVFFSTGTNLKVVGCVFVISCFGIEKAHSVVVCNIPLIGITATKRNSPKLFTQCHKIKSFYLKHFLKKGKGIQNPFLYKVLISSSFMIS